MPLTSNSKLDKTISASTGTDESAPRVAGMDADYVDYVDRAAVKVNGYIVSLPRPARHNAVWSHLVAHYPDIVALTPAIRTNRTADQFGFLTQSGKWLDRAAAKEHVKKIGQRAQFSENTQDLQGLYTEDLWEF